MSGGSVCAAERRREISIFLRGMFLGRWSGRGVGEVTVGFYKAARVARGGGRELSVLDTGLLLHEGVGWKVHVYERC